ncbi:ABC transporter ATP-binding protein [Gloeocapsopsis sp. IPPAS B-1203]|uniref:ABC transporter ATP-binding protein n=1 Tax=Gloeocapsopsis sp. IPPAS B-1203 TaxID=2049454 RepID=UPI000C19EE4D|nr:ABC transporter ATP-binding protein [Gloeocapsopsis sp. IPPAS B-1203]PIG94705.1 helicase [Gloeocapsopsis sp. IPPAS B-1203]
MNIPLKKYGYLLANYLKPQKGRVAWLVITLLGSIGLQVFNPQILGYFVDTATAGGSQSTLFVAAFLFILVALMIQGLAVAATYFGENVAWTATNELRADLAEHCLELDLSFHKSITPGELVERIDGDVNALSRFFSQFTIDVLGNTILLFGVLVALFWENWLAGFSMTLYALTALIVLMRVSAYAVPYWADLRQIHAEFFGFLGEHLGGTEDLRANDAIAYVMHRFYRILQHWLPIYHRARLAGAAIFGTSIGLVAMGDAIALGVGAYLWSQAAISIGTVYVIFHYANLLSPPIERIREELEDLQQAEASILRIKELFQLQSQLISGGDKPLPNSPLSVTFENVWFSYEERGKGTPQLQNISFYLPAGQTLGILGRTGSGKTTLARLLLRLYDPYSGKIRLGGVAIDQTPLQNLSQRLGMVTQDVQLFQTTVRNNLTFFNSKIGEARILNVLEMLGLSQWLYSLPDGLDTQLGSDSGGLSAGQAQLLAFARVFLKDPGLVILDEASSRLDSTTENLIECAVDRLLKGRTGIIIAHRLGTVQRADQIMILDNGRTIEYGMRENLAKNPASRFAQLLKTGSTTELE